MKYTHAQIQEIIRREPAEIEIILQGSCSTLTN